MTIKAENVAMHRSGQSSGGNEMRFRLPNPGDVFMLAAFGWAAVCFLIVTGGERLARRAARLTSNPSLQDILLAEQSAVGALMILGIAGLGAAFYCFNRFQYASIGLLFFSMTFASALWAPLHDVAFVIKYLLLIYFGAYGFFFFLRNGWKLTEYDGYRIVLLYVGWIGFIALFYGLRIGDVWYTATEFILMVGVGIGWFGLIRNMDQFKAVNYAIAYTAVVVTITHFMAIVIIDSYVAEGRFQSYFSRATGFANIFAVFVVTLFWAAMSEERQIRRNIFAIVAIAGLGLLLWSGSRGATVASIVGIGAIWWVMRTRILLYLLFFAVLGLVGQLVLTENEELERLRSRMASTENTRLDVWGLYIEVWFGKFLHGHGFDGLPRAIYGETFADTISNFFRLQVPQVHNLYIGMGAKFGMVGLVFCVAIFYFSLRRAYDVIMSATVDIEIKRQYVLPTALVIVIMLEGLFEDMMGSTGRGTVHGVVLAMAMPLLYVYGGRILADAEGSREQAAVVAQKGLAAAPIKRMKRR